MKVICSLSGTEFEINTYHHDPVQNKRIYHNHFKSLNITDRHPIFTCSTEKLLEFASTWAARKLSKIESRLLFLALLNSTGLVVFRTIAIPSDKTVQNNMELLLKTVTWQSAISPALMKLPKFIISHDTRHLTFITNWLNTWNEHRAAWQKGTNLRTLSDKLEARERILERLIKSSSKNTTEYAGRLASWAFDASGLPNKTDVDKSLREHWLEIFKTKGFDIYNIKTADLEDMIDWFERNLIDFQGSIQAAEVLKHVRMLLNKNVRGLSSELGEFSETTFEIISDDIEEHNKRVIAANAPAAEPFEHQFKSRVEYLRAKSAWTLASSAKAAQANQIKRLEDTLQKRQLEMPVTEEKEADLQAEVDALQLEFKSILSENSGEEE